jgi:hypothetical protein
MTVPANRTPAPAGKALSNVQRRLSSNANAIRKYYSSLLASFLVLTYLPIVNQKDVVVVKIANVLLKTLPVTDVNALNDHASKASFRIDLIYDTHVLLLFNN